jgi:hypothetical protein
MQVKTIAVTLDVAIEQARIDGEALVLEGLAGMMACETRIARHELRSLLRLVLRWDVIRWALWGAKRPD